MKSPAALILPAVLIFLPIRGSGQSCNILSKANAIVPDQFCSPVEVNWDVTYVGVNNAGTTVEIHFDWDDGTSETVVAAEGPAGTFNADADHTYPSLNDRCNYHPVATLVVDGVRCTSSSQEQIVTVWDTDNENGGEVNAEPDVYPVCVGNGATMRFGDGTLFNCVPPQEEDNPNVETRWIQWVYGTRNTMSSATPVSVDGFTGPWTLEGPVIELTGPVTVSSEQSLPITVADDNLVGEEFEVELRYWNYCNPYPAEDPVTDRSVIRIVDIPDPTITPVDTMCEFNPAMTLSAATPGGTWSGNGIIHQVTGEFAAYVAGPGTHQVIYNVTDGNNCSASDTIGITVRDAPAATVFPAGPVCIYDAPIDLISVPVSGTWSGSGITNPATGLFDPAVAGIGTHHIAFSTDPDPYGCYGVDSLEIRVAGIPDASLITNDTAWCEQPDNQSAARVVIFGADTSLFDLVLESNGTLDTIFDLTADTLLLTLDHQVGRNEYILKKVIEKHAANSCDADLNDTLIVEVYPKPDMTVSAELDDFCSPVDVDFSATEGYDKYYWKFGDGDSTLVRTENHTHTYTLPIGDSLYFRVDTIDGVIDTTYYPVFQLDTTYQYRLVIESFRGCRDTITDSLTIYASPEANFFVSPEIQSYPETDVFLINRSSYGQWSYLWDFGDGDTSSLKEPTGHNYDSTGFFDIGLKTFNLYCRDSITKRIQILPPPPVSEFGPDSIGCPPLKISFYNNSQYADSYIWNFDDGTFSTEQTPTHTFYESREHHVRLEAYGLSGSDTTEQIISLYPRPTALFDVYPLEAKNLKQVFKFMNNSVKGSYYLWDFGDGNTSPEENASHIYGEEGVYTITLYAWSENDCPDTLIREQLINVTAGEGSVEFPNAFVWNGSGPTGGQWSENTIDNTVFHPNLINASQLKMIIYTRWGEKLFETNEVYVGWDGYLESGELASPGVYVYKAWVTYMDGTEELMTGDITFLH